MAIVTFTVKSVSRAMGSSAVSRAAYISRERLRDDHLHRSYDYRARGGLEHSEILLPTHVRPEGTEWARDRTNLWNGAEAAERRADARVAREYVIGLPHELPGPDRLALARDFAQVLADRYTVATDLAVHRAPEGGDPRNHHAHILTTTREIGAAGLGRKATMELRDDTRRAAGLAVASEEIRRLRHLWVDHVNERLKDAKLDIVLDARSYWEQGSARVPTRTLGPAIVALERAGIATDVAARLRHEHAVEQQRMTAFAEAHARSLAGRDAARELPTPAAERPLTIEERQARAAARWADYRQEYEAGRRPAPSIAIDRERDRGAELEF